MPGKANIYALGTEGVNRVMSPVHVPDGSLLSAQNAEISPDKGQRGLRKRGGMAKITNGGAAAGAILSMSLIPLADPYGSIYSYDANDVLFRISDDGLTWGTAAAPFTPTVAINYRNRIWYFNGTNLFSWDGTTITDHGTGASFINQPTALAVDTTNGGIVIYGQNVAFLNLVGYRYNVDAATFTALTPPAAPSATAALSVLDGTVYGGGNTAAIWRYTGAAWTTEFAIPSAVQAMQMTQFGGKIYAACMPIGADPNTDKILRRDSAGSWTTVVNASDQFRLICKAGDRIFAHRLGVARTELWSSTDGTTWASELDLTTLGFGFSSLPGLFEWNDTLFVVNSTLGVYRRSGLGVLQQVVNNSGMSGFTWL